MNDPSPLLSVSASRCNAALEPAEPGAIVVFCHDAGWLGDDSLMAPLQRALTLSCQTGEPHPPDTPRQSRLPDSTPLCLHLQPLP